MKKILRYLREQIREDLHVPYYTTVALFLAISLIINYTVDFNDRYIDGINGFGRILANVLFFAVAYFILLVLFSFFKKQGAIFSNREFLLKSMFGLVLLGLDSGFPYLQQWLNSLDSHIQFWAYKVCINSISLLTIVLPLYLFYVWIEKHKCAFYGLGKTRFDWSPYVTMLLIMVPLIASASLTEGFQRQYPMYKSTSAHTHLGVAEYVTVLIYEAAYGFDFITVELLFRGFFVVGMIHVLGRAAILPMVSMYCFLHFGKPAGEAISSIFGGYILGVIAYETRSIWGGIAIHVGIAWLMEVSAWLMM